MKLYVLSDNIDTLMGMRLAGIEGQIAHTAQETQEAIERAVSDKELALLLITEKLVSLCPELISERKLYHKRPLIVEIPDRHGGDHIASTLERYISESIGIKM